MYRTLLFFFLLCSFAQAQTKKPQTKTKPATEVVNDSLSKDTTAKAPEVEVISREFGVLTKRPKTNKDRMKLCLNLVSPDTVLNYCVNDSVLRDPEVSKVLFQKKQGDTTYVLVYVAAFSKPKDKVECDAGKEVKLIFVRWNTKTNKPLVKQKIIESCMRGIMNMTKEPITAWDGTSTLVVNYYRGGNDFIDLKFDPQNFLIGMQSSKDN